MGFWDKKELRGPWRKVSLAFFVIASFLILVFIGTTIASPVTGLIIIIAVSPVYFLDSNALIYAVAYIVAGGLFLASGTALGFVLNKFFISLIEKKKGLKNPIWKIFLVGVGVIFLIGLTFLSYNAVSVFSDMQRVIQGEPMAKFLCVINPMAEVDNLESIDCSDEEHYLFGIFLEDWKGYHGCNNSTYGFDGEHSLINLETCDPIHINV